MPPTTDLPQKRVLVVDDSRFVRTTFASILKASFGVREEADGEAAWHAGERDPSLVMVFTDLAMPKPDGFGLPDPPAFDDWRDVERERYRRLVIRGVTALTEETEAAGSPERAPDALPRGPCLHPPQSGHPPDAIRVHDIGGTR